MKIFSTHRKKLEPSRRFGGRAFRDRIRLAANYKRVFSQGSGTWLSKLRGKLGFTRKFWITFAAVIFLVLFYYLCVSTGFVITDVAIAGNSQVSTQSIEDVLDSAGQSRLFFIKKTSFFLMSQGRVSKLLTGALPTIKEVSSKRTWPNRISIEVKERMPGFVIDSNGKYFLVDEDGIVISQMDSPSGMLVVADQLTESFATGEAINNSKLAPFVLSMSRQWNGKVATHVASVKFPGKGSSDVQFVSEEGWSVLFDTSRSVVAQLDSLSVLLNKQIAANDRARLVYIDLRLSKWAYYCLVATPCSQQPQEETAGTNTTDATKK